MLEGCRKLQRPILRAMCLLGTRLFLGQPVGTESAVGRLYLAQFQLSMTASTPRQEFQESERVTQTIDFVLWPFTAGTSSCSTQQTHLVVYHGPMQEADPLLKIRLCTEVLREGAHFQLPTAH